MCGKEKEVFSIPQLGYKTCDECKDELKDYIEEYRRRMEDTSEAMDVK